MTDFLLIETVDPTSELKLKYIYKTSCRACLGSGENLDIFDLKFEDMEISEIFKMCTSIQLDYSSEKIPVYICQDCLRELIVTYKFIKKCQATETKLRSSNIQLESIQIPIKVQAEEDTVGDAHENVSETILLDVINDMEPTEATNEELSFHSLQEDECLKMHDIHCKTEDCADVKVEIAENGVQQTFPKLPFPCDICHEGFLIQDHLNLHMKFHTNQKSKICPHCGKFSINIRQHIRLTHSTDSVHYCDICNKQVASRKALRMHLPTHKKAHKCHICQKVFKSKTILNDHVNTHTGFKPYSCTQCSKTFRQKSSLRLHLQYHQGIKNHCCHKCGKAFVRKSDLGYHIISHQEEKPFICEYCGKTFGWYRTLQKHTIRCGKNMLEDKSRLRPFSCTYCEKSYTRAGDLKFHLRIHTGERFFKCILCEETFLYIHSARKHLTKVHSTKYEDNSSLIIKSTIEIKKAVESTKSEETKLTEESKIKVPQGYECKFCCTKFSTKDILFYHTMTHTGDRPHVCKICNKGFIQKNNLALHMKRHAGETPFVCEYCSKGFTNPWVFREHLEIHEPPGDPIECETCHKVLRSQKAYKRHQVVHNKKYLCNYCGNNYVNITQLSDHLNVHNGLRPYTCKVCSKTFHQKVDLKKHGMCHAKEKPFVCDYCDKAFMTKYKVRRHMTGVHRDYFAETGIKKEDS